MSHDNVSRQVANGSNRQGGLRGIAKYFGVTAVLFLLICWLLSQTYSLPPNWGREENVYFEWDSTHGVKVVRAEDQSGVPIGNRLSLYVIELQIKGRLDSYLRVPGWNIANGHLSVTVGKLVPVAYPTALGSGGEVIVDPEETPLMRAAAEGSIDLVRQMLARGANVNARDQWKQTALIDACMHGRSSPDLVRLLVAAGADVNAQDDRGRTPLLLATGTVESVPGMQERDGAGVVRELLSANANVNAKDVKGVTPLIMAVRNADLTTVQALLKAGADAGARDGDGETAISVAMKENRQDIAKVLQGNGATEP